MNLDEPQIYSSRFQLNQDAINTQQVSHVNDNSFPSDNDDNEQKLSDSVPSPINKSSIVLKPSNQKTLPDTQLQSRGSQSFLLKSDLASSIRYQKPQQ